MSSSSTPQLDNYQLLEKVGQGGMGAVYRARQISVDRIVAVKILAPQLAKDSQFVDRFLREARAAANLSHPNLIHVYDCGTCGQWHYFSMEYVAGANLREVVEDNGPLDEPTVISHMISVADALRVAHAKHIIHRDVKPENIILTADGKAKLADLGLAKPLTDNSDEPSNETAADSMSCEGDLTVAGTVLGTPRFMSPEQALRQPADQRSDLYSLGATMFWLLTGLAPFNGRNAKELMRHHIKTPPPPIRQLAPHISRQTETLLLRLLAKNPQERPQDAPQLIAALTQLGTSAGRMAGSGHRPRAARQGRSGGRQRQVGPTAAIIAGAAALMLIVLVLIGRSGPSVSGPSGPQAGGSNDTRPFDHHIPRHQASPTDPPARPRRQDQQRLEQAIALRQRGPQHFAAAAEILESLNGSDNADFNHSLAQEREALAEAQQAFRTRQLQELSSTVEAACARHDYDGALTALDSATPDLDELESLRATVHEQANSAIDDLVAAPVTDDDRFALEEAIIAARNIRYHHRQDDLTAFIQDITDTLQALDQGIIDEREERWLETARAVVDRILSGRTRDALNRLDRARVDPELAERVSAVEGIIEALASQRQRAATALEQSIDTPITITTRQGPRQGLLSGTDPERGIALNLSSRDPSTGVVSEAIINIAWDQITAEQMSAWAGPWPDEHPADRLAQALDLIRQEQHDAARPLIDASPQHPLHQSLSERVSDTSTQPGPQEPDDERARSTWESLSRQYQRRMNPEEAQDLLNRLDRWRQDHAGSAFAARHADRVKQMRQQLHSIAYSNLIANGDFEGSDLSHWQREGQAHSRLSVVGARSGRQFLHIHGTRHNTMTLTTTRTMPIAATMDFSIWLRCATIITNATVTVHNGRNQVFSEQVSGRNPRGRIINDGWQNLTGSFTVQSGDTLTVTITGESRDTLDLGIDDLVLRPRLDP